MKRVVDLGRKLPALTALVAAMAGCAAIFGIDEPSPESCLKGVCGVAPEAGSPATVDATTADSATGGDATPGDEESVDEATVEGAAADAPPDQGPQTGPRCGNGALRCSGATPSCCEFAGDGGGAYGCVAAHALCNTPDYWIQCASAADCVGTFAGDVCCWYNSSIKCEPSCSKASIVVCDPNADGGCPPGKPCNVPIPNLPYFTCAP